MAHQWTQSRIALSLIRADLTRFKDRQKYRIKQLESGQIKILDDSFYYAKYHIRELEKFIKKLEKIEERDRLVKRLDRPARNKMAGINRLGGSYGR